MDALEYEKARIRMCNTTLLKEGSCVACQLYDELKLRCRVMESVRSPADEDYCRKTVSIVEQWAKDHPVKTRQSEFLKLFPNADLKIITRLLPCSLDGTLKPLRCAEYGYLSITCRCDRCRDDYWNEEVSE